MYYSTLLIMLIFSLAITNNQRAMPRLAATILSLRNWMTKAIVIKIRINLYGRRHKNNWGPWSGKIKLVYWWNTLGKHTILLIVYEYPYFANKTHFYHKHKKAIVSLTTAYSYNSNVYIPSFANILYPKYILANAIYTQQNCEIYFLICKY